MHRSRKSWRLQPCVSHPALGNQNRVRIKNTGPVTTVQTPLNINRIEPSIVMGTYPQALPHFIIKMSPTAALDDILDNRDPMAGAVAVAFVHVGRAAKETDRHARHGP